MRYPIKKYAQALYEASHGKSAAEIDKVVKNFIALLYHYHDRSLLSRIIEQYEKIRRQKEGVVKVEVTSAKKLTGKIRADIEKRFRGAVEVSEKVHPEALGGIKLVINDEYLVDGTMQGRVEKLYKALMAGAQK